ncbi:MAG TPA: GAF domain-containing protein [Phycisphaerales bacterium]|nr:GAF domain-containing protein [Phycisphaerales bacterium]HRQ76130.1 GAF domain-containing protein [Phycisphaerales bacterium]
MNKASRSDRYQAVLNHMPLQGNRAQRMARLIDLLWDHLRDTDVSWIGFYLDQPGEMDDRRLVLGPCRDKPACSPIGMHGACGQALSSRQVRVIHDVAELGENYIACDPRDRSELVLPLFDERGKCWGVLDVDSWEVGSFDESDAAQLNAVLVAAQLTTNDSVPE